MKQLKLEMETSAKNPEKDKHNGLLFLDTETTGNDVEKDRLCQVCYKVHNKFCTEFFKPPVPISVKSMSITHITNKMVNDKEPFQGSKTRENLAKLLEENILVAHNAKFDIAMLEAEGVKVPKSICTLRLVRHLDKYDEIPEYNLQYLRYHYDLEIDGNAHDAEGDVRVLEAIFDVLYKKMSEAMDGNDDSKKIISEMLEISARPSLIRKMPFGKHIGVTLEELAANDPKYLQWLLGQKQQDGDEDWVYSIKYWLKAGLINPVKI